MKISIWIRRPISALLLSIITPLWAQESADESEEVFELSPFEVTTDENVGYLANNTLAGTRLNAQLSDIANAVQVLTSEFIEDTGASNFEELLIYATGTEAFGVNGNSSFGETGSGGTSGEINEERARREPQLNTRVRGLARADLARDYFLSDIEFHPYIISEVTINRGPNASLFGLGSPGGIINSAIDRAETNRSRGVIDLRLDQFGTVQASINYNLAAIKDKLAVRVAALDSNKRYEQEQAYYDEERYFAAVTLRPWKGAAIRANYEEGEGAGSRPIGVLPIDGITNWLENGKPSYRPDTDQWFVNGSLVTDPDYADALEEATTFIFRAGITRDGGPIAVFEDPTSPVMGSQSGYATLQPGLRSNAVGRTADTYPFNGDAAMRKWSQTQRMYYRNPDYIVGAIPDFPVSSRNYYFTHMLEDRSVFDYRKNSILGPAPLHTQEFDVYSIRAEQTLFDNQLGIEVAYQEQYWEAFLAESKGIEITPDINLTLLDGTPNPNYGRPYAGNRGYSQATIREREAFQVIGFAKYDFNDKHDGLLRHFGKHTLTGVYQDQENTSMAPNLMYTRVNADWAAQMAVGRIQVAEAALGTTFVDQGKVRGHVMQYVGPSLADINSLDQAVIQPVTARQVPSGTTDNALVWNPFTGNWERGSATWYSFHDNRNDVWAFGNNRLTEWIESYSSVLQSHWLNGHLVTTVSWRRDTVEQATGQGERDPETNLFYPVTPELDPPFLAETVEQTSYGIVAHVPDKWLPKGYGLSLHYVDSSNFAAGVTGVDIFNRPGPLQTGVTEEYGFAAEAFDRKFYLRVNWFETIQENDVLTGGLVQIGNDLANVMRYNTPEELAAAGWDLETTFAPGFLEAIDFAPVDPNVPNNETFWTYTNISGSPTNHYQDTQTEGVEIELSYAPTSQWRITLNVSSAEVVVSDVMKISAPELKRIANEIFLDENIGQLWIVPNRTSAGNLGRLRSRADNLLSAIAIREADEGGPLPEVTKWRFNFLTNYKFKKDTALDGFSVGAGIRWQEGRYLGSAIQEIDGTWVPDYSQKYYGDDELDIDTWLSYSKKIFDDMNLTLQLRIRNITAGSNDLVAVRADPDGTERIKVMDAPRYVELRATLSF